MVTEFDKATAAALTQPGAQRKLRAAERRALIEAAAAQLFARQGYEATTVEQIAAVAGVSKPIVYRHFDSKRELQMRLMERRRDELAAEPLGAFLEASGTPQERLAVMVDAWFAHVAEHPDSAKVLLADAGGDPEIRALQQELRRRQRAADVAMLREFGPPLAEAELEPLGEIIRSSLTALALWWLDSGGVPRSTVVGAMMRMLTGLLSAPA